MLIYLPQMVTMNIRLKALVVDDSDSTQHFIADQLSKADIDSTLAGCNDDAFEFLDKIIASKAQLDVITTDIVREGGYGTDFVVRIRNLPDEITIEGGLRLRHIPIVVLTGMGYDVAKIEIPKIDSRIPILRKDSLQEFELIQAVDEAICSYRNEVLSGLQRIGLAFVWHGGRFQVVNAYAQFHSDFIETKHLAGGADDTGASYSRLVLAADRWQVAEVAVNQFEALLNDPKTTEKDFQHFLELHPEFLLRDEYDSYWAEPVIKSLATMKQIRPDFVLQPHGIRLGSWNWAVVDLKRPSVPLLTHKRFHLDLSQHVYRVATQLRDYSQFFADPRNHDVIKGRFGGIVPNPKLVAVIGRLSNEHRDEYAVLRSRITGVSIATYDEILEFRRAKVEWIKSLM